MRWTHSVLLAAGLALMGASSAQAGFTYTILDFPGSIYTDATDINHSGTVVGAYQDASGFYHGYTYDSGTGTYTSLDYPGAVNTYGDHINASGQVSSTWDDGLVSQGYRYDGSYNQVNASSLGAVATGSPDDYLSINDAGNVAGTYFDGVGDRHGFYYDAGTNSYLNIDPAGSTDTSVSGLDALGNVAGTYEDGLGVHGFVYDAATATYTTLDVPGAVITVVNDIDNAGDVAGYYFDSFGIHGFAYDGTFTDIIPPNFFDESVVTGIDSMQGMVGIYPGFFGDRGFYFDGVKYYKFSAPGAFETDPNAINDVGLIVGNLDDGFTDHGFIAEHTSTVPEPSSVSLFGAAILALFGFGWVRKRRAA